MKKLLFFLLMIFALASPSHGVMVIGSGTTGPDTTAPTLSTATIENNGTTWTLIFNESVQIGAGGNAGWAVTMSTAGAITLTYGSGSGTDTLIYSGSPTVNNSETVSSGLDYTQPGNGIEDIAGNDLVTLTSHAVINNSGQGGVGVHNIDYYPEGNYDSYAGIYGVESNTSVAQSFTGDGSNLATAKFYLAHVGSPTGNITVKLYSHSGTFGTSSMPDTLLATSNTVAATAGTTEFPTFGLVSFTFSSPYATVNGTKYVLAVEYSAGDNDNKIRVGIDSSSPTHAGNYSSNYGGWGFDASIDLIFYAISN